VKYAVQSAIAKHSSNPSQIHLRAVMERMRPANARAAIISPWSILCKKGGQVEVLTSR
jgi:hypothetical protein